MGPYQMKQEIDRQTDDQQNL